VELNWSTFILELVNFLVLVWLLKRFLYKPVLRIIAQRRTAIEATLAEAEARHQEAQKLQAQYEGRQDSWEQEQRKARDALDRELEHERQRRHTQLLAGLEQEQQKARVTQARRDADTLHQLEATALAHGATFATRLLSQAATPALQERLIDLLCEDLAALPAERVTRLREQVGTPDEHIVVTSAWPLDDAQRNRLQQAIAGLTAATVQLQFEQQAELLAGVRIVLGDWIIGANLQDELRAFAELEHD
jgi:F-type H+-transporting ATPase subunit b